MLNPHSLSFLILVSISLASSWLTTQRVVSHWLPWVASHGPLARQLEMNTRFGRGFTPVETPVLLLEFTQLWNNFQGIKRDVEDARAFGRRTPDC